MKWILLTSLLAASAIRASAQDPAAAAKLEAQKSAKALLTGDYEQVISYTPKRAVAAMGGKDAAVASLKKGVDDMKAQGVSFKDATVGDPGSMQQIGAWLVCLIPQKVTLKVPGGQVESEAYLIGISEDSGKSWVFADSTSLAKENGAIFTQMFPELAGKLHIPEKKENVFKPD